MTHSGDYGLWSLVIVNSAVFIIFAFTGYVEDAMYVFETSPLGGVSDLCALVGQNWSYATTFGEYAEITAANCASFSNLHQFVRFDGHVLDLPV